MKNPFLDTSFHIQWSRMQPEHISPAIEEALAEAQTKIDAVANREKADITFASSFLALEKATEDLGIAWAKVGHLDTVSNSPELRKAYNEMLPQVADFFARIPLNEKLWMVLKTCAEKNKKNSLNPVQQRYLDETLAEFREHGADLPAGKKERLRNLAQELANITQKYSENVLDAINAFALVVQDREKLAGLPERDIEQARLDALVNGCGTEENPQWRFTLRMPSLLPVMKYAHHDGFRKTMWEADSAIGRKEPVNNLKLIEKILTLRQEKAELLGKKHFADFILTRRMAKNGAAALGFVEYLREKIDNAFARENKALEDFRGRALNNRSEPFEPWELAYWSESMRRQKYDFEEEDLRSYFPIEPVISGMFQIAETIFNIQLKERPVKFVEPDQENSPHDDVVEGWHPEVKYYEVRELGGEILGAFYADWHPRESKRGGAWMNYLMTGSPPNGKRREPHLGLICGNLTPSIKDQPALLTHYEVQTIFHEFGHLLHHLLGDVEIKSLNGINVPWDFVELPSQIMENWCWQREGLDLFARHYETGETIPEDLFRKMTEARNFQSARKTMRQLSFGKMDLEMHMASPHLWGENLEAWVDNILQGYQTPTKTKPPSIIGRFTHVFADSTGYAAAYYSYKWAEVLDADAFTRFKKEGILNPAAGRDFREKILSRGNSADPAELFRNFMGRDPGLQALLDREGLGNNQTDCDKSGKS